MVHLDELNGKDSYLLPVPRLDLPELRFMFRRQLFKPAMYEPNSQFCRVDGRVDFMKEIGDRSNMIFMAVCNYNPFYFGSLFPDIAEVRDDIINTGHFIGGKHDATVNDDDLITIFK